MSSRCMKNRRFQLRRPPFAQLRVPPLPPPFFSSQPRFSTRLPAPCPAVLARGFFTLRERSELSRFSRASASTSATKSLCCSIAWRRCGSAALLLACAVPCGSPRGPAC